MITLDAFNVGAFIDSSFYCTILNLPPFLVLLLLLQTVPSPKWKLTKSFKEKNETDASFNSVVRVALHHSGSIAVIDDDKGLNRMTHGCVCQVFMVSTAVRSPHFL